MRQTANRAGDGADGPFALFVRSVVVFASLASFCVSDGIGPRLLPFPARPGHEQAEQVAPTAAADEGRLPATRAEAHAASGHQPKAVTPVWNDASPDRAAISPPAGGAAPPPDLYASPCYSFRASSSTRGRAPPQNS